MFIFNHSSKSCRLMSQDNYYLEPIRQLHELKNAIENDYSFYESNKRFPLSKTSFASIVKIKEKAAKIFKDYELNRSFLSRCMDWIVSLFTSSEYEKNRNVNEWIQQNFKYQEPIEIKNVYRR